MKKKTFKKAGVAVLSMAMLLSMGAMATPVSAAADTTPYSVTIKNIKDYGYSYSKIASLDTDGVTYTVESAWSDYIKVGANNYLELKVAADAVNGKTKLSEITAAADIQTLATTLAGKNVAGTAVGNTSDTITTLTPGYYLFTSTNTYAQPMLIEVKGNITAADGLVAKANDVTITKTITSIADAKTTEDADDLVDANGKKGLVSNGATVTFKLETSLPYYDSANLVGADITNFTITDIPEDTLTNLTVTGVEVDGTAVVAGDATYQVTTGVANSALEATDAAGANYFAATTNDTAGTGVKIVFKDAYVLANGGKSVEVTLTAVVANADVKTDANSNTATVEYHNNYWTGGSQTRMVDDDNDPTTPDVEDTTPENPNDHDQDTVSVYATVLTVNKVDQDSRPLTDAVFELYSGTSATGAPIATLGDTVSLSTFVFSGLNVGTYTLHEKATPSAEYKRADDITFTVTETGFTGAFTFTNYADNTITYADGEIEVTNIMGQTLPDRKSVV